MELFCHEWKRRSLNSSLGVRNTNHLHGGGPLHVDAHHSINPSVYCNSSLTPVEEEHSWTVPQSIS